METVFTPNIESIETRLTEHGDVYCRYKIGPIYSKQALTLIQSIRTGMLNEVRGFAFVGVEILGVQNEFQLLKGVKESTVEVLLNLTRIVLAGNFFTKLPLLAYLSVNGPGEIKAKSLRLPPHIRCLNPDQVIATLSEKSVLEMKLLIKCTGGTNLHNGLDLKIHKNQTFPDISLSDLTGLDSLKKPSSNKKLQKELRIKPLYNTDNKNIERKDLPLYQQVVQKDFSFYFQNDRQLGLNPERSFATAFDAVSGSEPAVGSEHLPPLLPPYRDQYAGKSGGKGWKNQAKETEAEGLQSIDRKYTGKKDWAVVKKSKTFSQAYLTRFPPRWEKTHLLSLETQFSPVQAVIVGSQEEIRMGQEVVFLECQICTNGSIHPLAALNVGIANFLQTVSSVLWVNWVTMPRISNSLNFNKKNPLSQNEDPLVLQQPKLKKNILYRPVSGSPRWSDKKTKRKLNQRSQFIANKLEKMRDFLIVSALTFKPLERQKLFLYLFSLNSVKKAEKLKDQSLNRKLSKEPFPPYRFHEHLSMNRWRRFFPPQRDTNRLTGKSSPLIKTKLADFKEISQWQTSFQELSWKTSRKHQNLRILENRNQIRNQHLLVKNITLVKRDIF